jgi:hypothetical protein
VFDNDFRGPFRNGGIKHKVTPEKQKTVALMSGRGLSHEDIAYTIGVDRKALVKHYSHELKKGKIDTAGKITKSVVKIATDDEHKDQLKAAIYWLAAFYGVNPKPEAKTQEIPEIKINICHDKKDKSDVDID